MAREVWVVERNGKIGWNHFSNCSDKEEAEDGIERCKLLWPGVEFRVVRYVPEDEK